jgi:DNA polymerase-3 subunit delta
MKLEPRRVEGFLRAPGSARAVLLFGDDVGLIGDRATRLLRAVRGGSDDPFSVVTLTDGEWGAIPAEMASLSLSGGRRVVRVRDVTDGATGFVAAALAGPGQALLVLEAPGLPARAKLRALIEKAADAVAIGCYAADGEALRQSIARMLANRGQRADAETLDWLASQLGADLEVTRQEVEKLSLYAGSAAEITVVMARQCVGDLAGLSLEDALFAATAGELATADRALELALAEGVVPAQVTRAGLAHLHRLQRARLGMAAGATAAEAISSLKPPLFFRRKPAFTRALGLWSVPALQWAATRLWEAERACRRTRAPAEAIVRQALTAIAARAARAGRR